MSDSTTETDLPPTTPSSSGVTALRGLYEQWFLVVAITFALVGILGNGVVLFFIYANRRHKKHAHLMNTFLINQTLVDFISCSFMLVIFPLHFPPTRRIADTIAGLIDCVFVAGSGLIWTSLLISTASLVALTLDRYLKIAFPIFHRNSVTARMKSLAVAVVWIFPTAWQISWLFPTTKVAPDGACLIQSVWPSLLVVRIYTWLYLSFFFIFPTALFILCYGHMYFILRTQPKKSDRTNKMSSAQAKILIRTLCVVCGTFILLWTPVSCKYLMHILGYQVPFFFSGFSNLLCFSNSITNPIIYTFGVKDIRKFIISKMFCGKVQIAPSSSTSTAATSSALSTKNLAKRF